VTGHRFRCRLASLISAGAAAGLVLVAGPGPSSAQVTAGSVGGPTLAWERRLPGVTIRESSPVVANLNGPAVVVGAHDGSVYAFGLADGSTVPGWPVGTGHPINSSPAAADVRGIGTDQVFVGSGTADAGPCAGGGVFAFGAGGVNLWRDTGSDPDCGNEAFHASPVIGDINGDGVARVTLGALGLQAWSYAAGSGSVTHGWPSYTDDTVFSTAALADVTGSGVPAVIMGGDSSPGGPINWRGGLVRALAGDGHVLWQFPTDEIVRSSPAVGDLNGDGHPLIVFGTGEYWRNQPGGASDSTKVFALDTGGHERWSRDLGGVTLGSPALADVAGTGRPDVVIGTADGPNPGKVWVLDGAGNPLPNWAGRDSGGGVVIGGITTADLNGDGAQDLVVPTGGGVFAYDGRTGARLFGLDEGQLAVQNSVLVTDDGAGRVGLTVAGTAPDGTGVVQHFVMPAASSARLGTVGWPMFHHDPRHTGNLAPPALTVSLCAGRTDVGYWFTARDGGVFSFCAAGFHGSAVGVDGSGVVGLASSADGGGYWVAFGDGRVAAYGDAPSLGPPGPQPLARPVVAVMRTPTGKGYWLVGADGAVLPFGDAVSHGSLAGTPLNQPVVGATATADGGGYWLVASDGGIFAFGDAAYHGSTGNIRLNQPIVAMAHTPDGGGYWLVASDGGIFAFGDAGFVGSAGGLRLNRPVVGMAATPSGRGYWLVASDGGVFAFGDAQFVGSTGAITLNQPISAMAVPGG